MSARPARAKEPTAMANGNGREAINKQVVTNIMEATGASFEDCMYMYDICQQDANETTSRLLDNPFSEVINRKKLAKKQREEEKKKEGAKVVEVSRRTGSGTSRNRGRADRSDGRDRGRGDDRPPRGARAQPANGATHKLQEEPASAAGAAGDLPDASPGDAGGDRDAPGEPQAVPMPSPARPGAYSQALSGGVPHATPPQPQPIRPGFAGKTGTMADLFKEKPPAPALPATAPAPAPAPAPVAPPPPAASPPAATSPAAPMPSAAPPAAAPESQQQHNAWESAPAPPAPAVEKLEPLPPLAGPVIAPPAKQVPHSGPVASIAPPALVAPPASQDPLAAMLRVQPSAAPSLLEQAPTGATTSELYGRGLVDQPASIFSSALQSGGGWGPLGSKPAPTAPFSTVASQLSKPAVISAVPGPNLTTSVGFSAAQPISAPLPTVSAATVGDSSSAVGSLGAPDQDRSLEDMMKNHNLQFGTMQNLPVAPMQNSSSLFSSMGLAAPNSQAGSQGLQPSVLPTSQPVSQGLQHTHQAAVDAFKPSASEAQYGRAFQGSFPQTAAAPAAAKPAPGPPPPTTTAGSYGEGTNNQYYPYTNPQQYGYPQEYMQNQQAGGYAGGQQGYNTQQYNNQQFNSDHFNPAAPHFNPQAEPVVPAAKPAVPPPAASKVEGQQAQAQSYDQGNYTAGYQQQPAQNAREYAAQQGGGARAYPAQGQPQNRDFQPQQTSTARDYQQPAAGGSYQRQQANAQHEYSQQQHQAPAVPQRDYPQQQPLGANSGRGEYSQTPQGVPQSRDIYPSAPGVPSGRENYQTQPQVAATARDFSAQNQGVGNPRDGYQGQHGVGNARDNYQMSQGAGNMRDAYQGAGNNAREHYQTQQGAANARDGYQGQQAIGNARDGYQPQQQGVANARDAYNQQQQVGGTARDGYAPQQGGNARDGYQAQQGVGSGQQYGSQGSTASSGKYNQVAPVAQPAQAAPQAAPAPPAVPTPAVSTAPVMPAAQVPGGGAVPPNPAAAVPYGGVAANLYGGYNAQGVYQAAGYGAFQGAGYGHQYPYGMYPNAQQGVPAYPQNSAAGYAALNNSAPYSKGNYGYGQGGYAQGPYDTGVSGFGGKQQAGENDVHAQGGNGAQDARMSGGGDTASTGSHGSHRSHGQQQHMPQRDYYNNATLAGASGQHAGGRADAAGYQYNPNPYNYNNPYPQNNYPAYYQAGATGPNGQYGK